MKTAERFAILSVWEMYSPIVKGVAKDYSLEVEVRGNRQQPGFRSKTKRKFHLPFYVLICFCGAG
jgi:hypothetical protein